MQKTKTSPDSFLESLPDDKRADMKALDKLITEAVDGKTRVMWEGVFWGGSKQNIIGYGDVRYKRPTGDVEWFIVGLSLQKNYISIYVNAVEDKQYLAEKYKSKLGKVKVGKSSISFANLGDVDLDTLIEVVKKAKDLSTSL